MCILNELAYELQTDFGQANQTIKNFYEMLSG